MAEIESQKTKKKTRKTTVKEEKSIIFIPAIGTLGDVLPFLALAERLAKRGHLVRFAMHQRHKHLLKPLPGPFYSKLGITHVTRKH
jgi:UDP:flavonoid glycosyltransferase YjiC (YdhE family)